MTNNTMQTKVWGATGTQVSVIGQGTWYIDHGNHAAAVGALQKGLDLGMTHIDTAEMYDDAELVVADAIKDCSKRGQIVLDPFCGSGTILIAAEKTGRVARAIELDPAYVDVAVRRWEQYTGKKASLYPMQETFEELAETRAA